MFTCTTKACMRLTKNAIVIAEEVLFGPDERNSALTELWERAVEGRCEFPGFVCATLLKPNAELQMGRDARITTTLTQ